MSISNYYLALEGKPIVTSPVVVSGKSRTKQAFKEQTDINKIIARFNKTGMITHLNRKAPFYGDVSGFVDYQDALEKVAAAQELFRGMSSEVRERFDNDPAKMVAFLNNPSNLDEAIKLGMAVKRPVVAPEAPAAPAGTGSPK